MKSLESYIFLVKDYIMNNVMSYTIFSGSCLYMASITVQSRYNIGGLYVFSHCVALHSFIL